MKLSRPINIIDVEATGLDPAKDRIVTLCIVKVTPENTRITRNWMFNPEMTMSDEVIAIHGITNAMVQDKPLFCTAAAEIHAMLARCDVAGYNLGNFDMPIIWEELSRCGITWDLTGISHVDVGGIFRNKEPRSLEAAVEFYLGRKHTGAHSAEADTMATLDVLLAQMNRGGHYQDLAEADVPTLAKAGAYGDKVDLAGIIIRNRDGVPCYGTKRNRGVPVADELSYGSWILRSDFPAQTRHVLRKIIDDITAAHVDRNQKSLF